VFIQPITKNNLGAHMSELILLPIRTLTGSAFELG
jgi:hypothetical protein